MFRWLCASLLIHAAIFALLLVAFPAGKRGDGEGEGGLRICAFIVRSGPGTGGPQTDGTQEVDAAPRQARSVPTRQEAVRQEAPQPAEPVREKPKKPAEPPIPAPAAAEVPPAPEPAFAPAEEAAALVQETADVVEPGDDQSASDGAGSGASTASAASPGPGSEAGAPSSGGGGEEGIFRLKDLDARPQYLVNVKPDYPRYAEEHRIEGSVTVSFVLDKAGNVMDAVVLRSDPPNVFETAALEAVRKWKFTPAIRKGEAVKVRMMVSLKFSLDRD